MRHAANKLILGVLGPGAGYAASLSNMELWLRVLSLVIGCAVGIASLISICFSIRRKYRAWKAEQKNKAKYDYQDDEPTTTI
jgi:membrane protein DedA with SNARE-associated domain